jgi:steroid delta-isomerase-like uncharacterized protein
MAPVMTRAEIATLVALRGDAMNRHDPAGLSRLYAPECRVESPTAGRVVTGVQAVDDINRAWFAGFPDVVFTTTDVLADEDQYAWIVTATGTDTGGFMGLPPTGRFFELPMVLLCRLRDGQIVDERRIYDFTGMLIQIGILAAKASLSTAARVRAASPPLDVPAGHTSPTISSVLRAEILALLDQRHAAWTRRDLHALADQHAEDCVMDSHLAGRVEDRTAIAAVYDAWFDAFPDSVLTPERAIVDGNRVAEMVIQTGTDTGGFLGAPPTGKPFRLPIVWLMTIDKGRFSYVRPLYDFTGLLVQIGVLRAKPA